MSNREFQRIPYSVQVQFRTASSFLVAYSVNLSRGGIFLETDQVFPMGTEVQLQFAVPGAGPMLLKGHVTWAREEQAPDGPPGMGVEFRDMGDSLGAVIDRLVADFAGVNILMVSADDQDRATLSRLIRQIIATAEVIGAGEAKVARALLGDEIDLVVIEVDSQTEEALAMISVAASESNHVPIIALGSTRELRDQARTAGANEVSSNPPPSTEFQRILVQALGKPATVRKS